MPTWPRSTAPSNKKVKDDLIFFHSKLAADKGGEFSIVASSSLSKNAIEEDDLGAHMRVRFQVAADGGALNSTIVSVEPTTAPAGE